MMEALGDSCKLCLKWSEGDGLSTIDENVLDKLGFLQMDLVSTYIISAQVDPLRQPLKYIHRTFF